MWKEEALWIGAKIELLDFQGAKVRCLNIGSSTRAYREVTKPYIDKYALAPIRKMGLLWHLDAKEDEGVDLCGDLGDPSFRASLSTNKFNLMLCNNVLTHVRNPNHVYELIQDCSQENCFVVITAPQVYPYCADPYDSKYRPSLSDIQSALPNFMVVCSTTFISTDTLWTRLAANNALAAAFIFNILIPRRGLQSWWHTISDLPNIFRPFSSQGVILQKRHDLR